MLGTILIIILILLLIGALPSWPYSTGWGYYPGGGLGLILDHRHCLGLSRKNIAGHVPAAVIASGAKQSSAVGSLDCVVA